MLEQHPRSIDKHAFKRQHVFDRASIKNRMHTRRIVADHTSEVGMGGRRHIRAEHQAVLGQLCVEMIEHQTRLDPGEFFLRVDFEYRATMGGKIDHDRRVDGLTGQGRPPASGKDRELLPLAILDDRLHILDMTGNHHPDRNHLIDARIGGIQHSIMKGKSNLTLDQGGKLPGDPLRGLTLGKCRVVVPDCQ